MALDALLARLEGRVVTPVTADAIADVTPKPAPMLACTPVTPVTPQNDNTAGEATSEPLSDPAMEGRRPRVLAEPETFTFTPPGDPANDAEAVSERAAIMAVENGWNEDRALQEARWTLDREKCWRAFLRNAERVLAAPGAKHEAMLSIYQAEAIRRYGENTGRDMALSLASWVRARRVH